MRNVSIKFSIFTVFVCLSTIPVMAQHTIWHSPLNFSTADLTLTINPSIPSTTIRVTSTTAGETWILLGLVIPSNVKIDSISVCYELSNSASFIAMTRLSQTTTPDAAATFPDDATPLTETVPTCYMSPVGTFGSVEGAMTLALRLNFASTSDWIDIGGIGVKVSPQTTTAVEVGQPQNPNKFTLKQNYPNPFKPSTTIEYELQQGGSVRIDVYNSLGEHVRRLVDGAEPQGIRNIIWDGRNNRGRLLASGVYYYQMKTGNYTGAKRMILIK